MASLGDISIDIKGDASDLSSSVKNAKSSLSEMKGEADSSGGAVSGLSGKMGGAAGAAGKLAGVAGGVATAVAGITAVAGAAAVKVATLTDKFSKSEKKARQYADILGVSRSEMMALNEAGAVFGADMDDTVDVLSELSESQQDLKEGSGRLTKALEGTSVSMEKLKNSDGPIDMLKSMKSELAGVSDETRRTVASAALGEEGLRKFGGVLSQSGKDLGQFKKRLKEAGIVLSDGMSKSLSTAASAMQRLRTFVRGTGKQIAAIASGSFTALVNTTTELIKIFKDLMPAVGSVSDTLTNLTEQGIIIVLAGMESLFSMIGKMAPQLKFWGEIIVRVTNVVASLGSMIASLVQINQSLHQMVMEVIKLLVKGLLKALEKVAGGFAKLANMLGASSLADQFEKEASQFSSLASGLVTDFQGAAQGIKDGASGIASSFEKTVSVDALETALGGISDKSSEAAKQLRKLIKERKKLAKQEDPQKGSDVEADRDPAPGGAEKSKLKDAPTKQEVSAQKQAEKAEGTDTKVDDLRAKKAKQVAQTEAKIADIRDQYKDTAERQRKIDVLRSKLAEKTQSIEKQISQEKKRQKGEQQKIVGSSQAQLDAMQQVNQAKKTSSKIDDLRAQKAKKIANIERKIAKIRNNPDLSGEEKRKKIRKQNLKKARKLNSIDSQISQAKTDKFESLADDIGSGVSEAEKLASTISNVSGAGEEAQRVINGVGQSLQGAVSVGTGLMTGNPMAVISGAVSLITGVIGAANKSGEEEDEEDDGPLRNKSDRKKLAEEIAKKNQERLGEEIRSARSISIDARGAVGVGSSEQEFARNMADLLEAERKKRESF